KCSASASAELYDPVTDSFAPTGSMVDLGDNPILLPNGKVLFLNGPRAAGSTTAQIYDPASGTFAPAGTGDIFGGPAALLPNGKVLIAASVNPEQLRFEIFDPAAGTYTLTNLSFSHLTELGTTVTPLNNGKILIAGGGDDFGDDLTAGIYDPSSTTITTTGNMTMGHGDFFTATSLADGRVLFAGGQTALGCN